MASSIDSRFALCPPLQEQIIDKLTGLPLANGVVKFYRDKDHNVPKSVYVLSGSAGAGYSYLPLGTQVTLSGFGTFVDSSGNPIIPLMFPYVCTIDGDYTTSTGVEDLYYVAVYDSDGLLQFEQQAWPFQAVANGDAQFNANTDNELANSQFSIVSFPNETQKTFTVTATSGSVEVAPNWFMDFTAPDTTARNFVLKQYIFATNNIESSPAYGLEIVSTSADFSTLHLRQRLEQSPRLLNAGFISPYVLAASQDAAAHTLTMHYVPSDGSSDTTLLSFTTQADNAFVGYSAAGVAITNENVQSAPDGYVDVYLNIPTGSSIHIVLSCIQIVGVYDAANEIKYIQKTTQRLTNELFQYYKDGLMNKPTASALVGWDFPVNPAQFGGDHVAASAAGAGKGYYAWDQTIIFQSVDTGFVIDRDTNKGLLVTCNAAGQMALVQYLPTNQLNRLLNNEMSINIAGFTSKSAGLKGTVSIYYTSNAAVPTLNNLFFTALNATTGKPDSATLVAGWSELSRVNNLGDAIFTLEKNTTSLNAFDYGFNGWDAAGNALIGSSTFIAVVVGFAPMVIADTASFLDISLVEGSIPTRSAPKSPDAVLRECEYYYEKSYLASAPAETSTAQNSIKTWTTAVGGPNQYAYPEAFTIEYKNIKRTTPSTVLYPAEGTTTAGYVRAEIWGNNSATPGSGAISQIKVDYPLVSTYWSVTNNNTKRINYESRTAAPMVSDSTSTNNRVKAYIYYHYIADARIGEV